MRQSTLLEQGNALRAFVAARLAALGRTQTEAERTAGLHKGFLGDLLRGQKNTIHGSNVAKLASALDVPVSRIAQLLDESAAPGRPGLDTALEQPTDPSAGRNGADPVALRRNPAQLDFDDASGCWKVPGDVIPSRPDSRPDEFMLVRLGSDAMEPEVARTDVVIIDTGQTILDGEGIWLVNEGAAQVLRRVILTNRDGQLCAILRASNQRYDDQSAPLAEVHVVGRCVGRITLF
jgi:phage repressor protein C with HTH and peptisase S24 domain